MDKKQAALWAIHLLMFASGFAGLVYEVLDHG
jgi:hypothetical protein